MPCFTVTSTTLDLKKASPEVMLDALKALGITQAFLSGGIVRGDGSINGVGRVSVSWSQNDGMIIGMARGVDAKAAETAIMQAYGKASLNAASKRFGWQVKTVGESKFQVMRR